MSGNSSFYGDITKWGMGVVEDIDDPLKAGRVRVRIYGIHTSLLDDLPTENLPWSQVAMPVTSASVSGIGDTPGLIVGSQVFGIFLDAADPSDPKQQFLVVGTMPGISGRTTVQADIDPPELDSNNVEVPARLVGDTNAEQAFHFLMQFGGYTEDQAAGIVGNLAHVKSEELPTSDDGIAKWKDERLQELKEFAASAGRNWEDLDVQLSYLLFELKGRYVHASNKVANTNTPGDAAEAFAEYYFGDTAGVDQRKTKARQAKAAFGYIQGGDTGSFTASSVPRDTYARDELVESKEELRNILESAKKKRSIGELIVHDTDTYDDEQVTTKDVADAHADFGGIQFHFLIQRNGNLQIGRDVALKESGISNTTVDENVTTMSSAGKEELKGYESLRLTAYDDLQPNAILTSESQILGTATIGYGNTTNVDNADIIDQTTITTSTAESYFDADVAVAEAGVLAGLEGRPINQNEFNAFVSLAFNIGVGAFQGSTALRRFNAGNKQGAADAILFFNKVTVDNVKVFNSGLDSRRKRERNTFLTPTSTEQRKTVTRLDNSISIAFAGGRLGSATLRGQLKGANYRQEQYDTFDWFVKQFIEVWPDSNILAHSDIDEESKDPGFNIPAYVEKFGHQNKEDAPSNPVQPSEQIKVTSPTPSSDIFEEPTSNDPVTLEVPAGESTTTTVEASGTSTVSTPGFTINLSPYLLITQFSTQFQNQSIFGLSDVLNTTYTNGQVPTWSTTNNRFEPGSGGGGGGGSGTMTTVKEAGVQVGGADIVTLDFDGTRFDITESPDTEINIDLSAAVQTSLGLADSSTQPGDNISTLTNDAGYVTATLTQEEVEDYAGALVATGGTKTGISVVYDDANGDMDFIVTGLTTTEFASANVSQWTNDAGYITATLTQEEVEDYAGALVATGGTKTLITVTYDDANGDMDFVVENDLSLYDNSTSAFLQNIVTDTTPQLGGSLDVNGNKIVSVSNGDIDIEPNGTGNVLLGNFTFDADQTVGAGQDDYVLTYDHGTGLISLEAAAGGGGGGDVTKVGTPVDNEVGVWTGDGTIEGDTNFTWDGNRLVINGTAGSGIDQSGLQVIGTNRFGGRIVVDDNQNVGTNYPGFSLYNEGTFEGGIFYDEADDEVQIFNSDISAITIKPGASGHVLVNQILNVGTSDVTGSAADAGLKLYGTASSMAGPHIEAYDATTGTTHPTFQILPWNSDNININFGAYYNSAWLSSDSGSNFRIAKNADSLVVTDAGGAVAVGGGITWENRIEVESGGRIIFNTPDSGDEIIMAQASSSYAAAAAQTVLQLVRNSTTDSICILEMQSGSSADCRIYFGDSDDTLRGAIYYRNGSGEEDMLFYTNNALRFEMDSDGDFIAEGNVTANGTASDIRYKENIEYGIPDALNNLMKLDAITFNYIDKDERLMGVIAQQVEEVAPELIWEGVIAPGEEKTRKQMRYGNFTAMLLEGVKTLKREKDELKDEVRKLREMVEKLIGQTTD